MADRLKSRRHRSVHLWPIVMLRVYAGVFFANAGIGKIGRDFGESMARFLSANLDESFAFYRPFVESVVLPNRGLFAALVAMARHFQASRVDIISGYRAQVQLDLAQERPRSGQAQPS